MNANEREARFAELAVELAPVAATFLRRRLHAVIGTQSLSNPGYPSLSAVPFAIAPEGWLVGLFSALAPHFPGLVADGRCALMLAADNDGDILAGERLELTCDARRLSDAVEIEEARETWVRCYPRGDAWFRQLDFEFFRLDVRAARYNGGFGRAAVLAPEALRLASPLDRAATRRVIAHMNDDHAGACAHYWQAAFGVAPVARVTLVALDALGMHLACDRKLRWIGFPRPVASTADVRAVLVEMAGQGIPE